MAGGRTLPFVNLQEDTQRYRGAWVFLSKRLKSSDTLNSTDVDSYDGTNSRTVFLYTTSNSATVIQCKSLQCFIDSILVFKYVSMRMIKIPT